MSEPLKINRTPIVWVENLGLGPLPTLGHSPLCGCEGCRLKEQARLGSQDNPLVVKAPDTLPS